MSEEAVIEVQTPQGQSFRIPFSNASTVADLKRLAAQQLGAASVRLATNGQILQENDNLMEMKIEGPLLAMAMPRSNPQAMRHQQASSLPEQEDNDLTLRLPANAPAWQQKLVRLMRKLHMPELVLYWIFAIHWRSWVKFAVFLALAPLANWLGIGPVYLLTAIIILIFSNLGTRKPGEASAYSLFNRGFRALPGQLTADEVDRQVRTGQA